MTGTPGLVPLTRMVVVVGQGSSKIAGTLEEPIQLSWQCAYTVLTLLPHPFTFLVSSSHAGGRRVVLQQHPTMLTASVCTKVRWAVSRLLLFTFLLVSYSRA